MMHSKIRHNKTLDTSTEYLQLLFPRPKQAERGFESSVWNHRTLPPQLPPATTAARLILIQPKIHLLVLSYLSHSYATLILNAIDFGCVALHRSLSQPN